MNKTELDYYLDSIIKLTNKACSLKHKEDFNDSPYLQNEYKKCYAKINGFKYKIQKEFDKCLLLITDANNN